jgi:hypothetical protein
MSLTVFKTFNVHFFQNVGKILKFREHPTVYICLFSYNSITSHEYHSNQYYNYLVYQISNYAQELRSDSAG